MSDSSIRVVQITDCHLVETPGDKLLSMDPDESLQDVLDLIHTNKDADCDLLLATGDLVNTPSLSAYERLYQTLSKQPAPFAWLPGNHDDPEMMAKWGKACNKKIITLGRWTIINLNSRLAGKTRGYVANTELSFLDEALKCQRDKHIMICLHHQPVPIGSAWMDNYIVENADALWQVIDAHPQVKIVLWGHVHQEFVSKRKDIHLLSTPSTCIQFTPKQAQFLLDKRMPGYRYLELFDNGQFRTEVLRVPQKHYGIDYTSAGY